MQNPKLGDVVNVYEDPMTETKLEERAKVIAHLHRSHGIPRVDSFYVEFLSEPGTEYIRQVLVDTDYQEPA